MLGVDYSFARPGGAAVKQAGYNFVCRYLASSAGKRIDAGEVANLFTYDLSIVLVFEDNANQALNGYNQGVADAQEALNQANALGFPSSLPIYFAVDFDISDAQKPAVGEYFKGVCSVLGLERVGAYGGYYLIKYVSENNLATFKWQTLAWSGGQVYPGTHIYQNGQSAFGGGADVDEALQSNYGQWSKEGEQNMPSLTGLDEARIIAWGVGGRNGIEVNGDNVVVDDTKNALSGDEDSDLNTNHVGKNLDDDLRGWYSSPEGVAWQHRLDNIVALAQQVAPLKAQIADLQTQLQTKEQPVASPVVNPPSPAPVHQPVKENWLHKLLVKFGIIKA